MARLNPSGMDALTIALVATACDALPAQLVPWCVNIAQQTSQPQPQPGEVADRLGRLGLRCRHEVWPDTDLARAAPHLTEKCLWALVWLAPDAIHPRNWWATLHVCDDGRYAVTYLVDSDPDECFCRVLMNDWTGHAVAIEGVPESSTLYCGYDSRSE